MSVTVLETENLSHVYSKGTTSQVHAIRDISLKIEKGELVGIIGHTGSGKSTLIQHSTDCSRARQAQYCLTARIYGAIKRTSATFVSE